MALFEHTFKLTKADIKNLSREEKLFMEYDIKRDFLPQTPLIKSFHIKFLIEYEVRGKVVPDHMVTFHRLPFQKDYVRIVFAHPHDRKRGFELELIHKDVGVKIDKKEKFKFINTD